MKIPTLRQRQRQRECDKCSDRHTQKKERRKIELGEGFVLSFGKKISRHRGDLYLEGGTALTKL